MLVLCFLFTLQSGNCQSKKLRYRYKTFQASFFPGMSTNGLASARYYNKFSLNLTSGISAGNQYLELGIISNGHTRKSSGIQIAGLANITGTNSYINLTNWEEKDMIKNGDRSDLDGLQFSGVLNFVRDNVTGFQFSGGFNVAMRNSMAGMIAGISNTVMGNFSGVQLAGFANEGRRSVTGVQISTLFNTTRGLLDGLQLGAFNRAAMLAGRNSLQPTSSRGVQIGLVNLSKINDGFQIGLINKTKGFRGLQIGLINLYRSSPYQGSQGRGRYGIPIGLVNLGGGVSMIRAYVDDIFISNFELSTGNCYNCTWSESKMPFDGKFMTFHLNSLIFSKNFFESSDSEFEWAAGYGFMRMHYNKSSQSKNDQNNKKYFVSYGMKFIHLNKERDFTSELSLLTKLHAEFGFKINAIKIYIFGGASLNNYLYKNDPLERKELASGLLSDFYYQLWPSYVFGIQI